MTRSNLRRDRQAPEATYEAALSRSGPIADSHDERMTAEQCAAGLREVFARCWGELS